MAIFVNGTVGTVGGNYMQKGVDYVTAGQKSGTTLGTSATAEGIDATASGQCSHAEGYSTTASGSNSHAEGFGSSASGIVSHAEGFSSTAYGLASHAEGGSSASGDYAHAEGSGTYAMAVCAHAEGCSTQAYGENAHAEGLGTWAARRSNHVFGEYNLEDRNGTQTTRGTYVEIVGNGTADDARSNARTLDWSGNEVLAGKLTVGAAPTANMDVTTKQYVDTGLSAKQKTITVSTNEPTSSDGVNGDIWFVYEE